MRNQTMKLDKYVIDDLVAKDRYNIFNEIQSPAAQTRLDRYLSWQVSKNLFIDKIGIFNKKAFKNYEHV